VAVAAASRRRGAGRRSGTARAAGAARGFLNTKSLQCGCQFGELVVELSELVLEGQADFVDGIGGSYG
jgi:hypothetical protein